MAIVAIFREPISQGFQLLTQAAHLLTVLLDHSVLLREQLLLLLDRFIPLRQLFSQNLILFSQIDQFFFDRHALTLLGLTPFGKSPAHLGSYYQTGVIDGKQTGGDPDMFKFFTERAYQLLSPNGYAGIILPHGIQSAIGCTALRRLLLDQCRLHILCKLDNERRIFSGVFHGQKFDLLIFEKGNTTEWIEAAFFSWEKAEVINSFRTHPRYVLIEANLLRELNSEQLTFIEFHNQREIELARRINAAFPRLDEQLQGTWNVSFTSGMHMTGDNHFFREGGRLKQFAAVEQEGGTLKTKAASWYDYQADKYTKDKRAVNSKGELYFPDELDTKNVKYVHEGYLLSGEQSKRQVLPVIANEFYFPLYEGRMVHQFDHAAKAYVRGSGRSAKWRELDFDEKKIIPHYYIARRDISQSGYRASFCCVTGQGNERSLLTAVLPPTYPYGHSIATVSFTMDDISVHLLWVALTNSFAADWLLRLIVSNNITFSILGSLALPRPKVESSEAQSLIQAALSLTCTTAEFANLWKEVTSKEWHENDGIKNVQDRAQLRAEIDARVADLYGLSEHDFAYILCTFPLLDRDQPVLLGEPKSFITRDLALLALFDLRGKAPPENIVNFFAEAGVDIHHQTGPVVNLRGRVRVALKELGAVAYQPSRRERVESDGEDEDEALNEFDEEE